MADVLVGSERRVLISGGGYGGLPPESLLCRLDQIDLRVRQLEEQRRPAAAAANTTARATLAARHQHTKSLPSALQNVQLRGTLMDRLNLLESRIRQLSSELDLDVGGNKAAAAAAAAALGLVAGTSSVEPGIVEDHEPPAPMLEPCRERAPLMQSSAVATDGSWSGAVEILQRGARQLHRNNKPNPSTSKQVKSLKEAKCACKKEKKKVERTRRWFGVGC